MNAVGWSGRTYENAKAVVEAAEKEPENYGHLVELMEDTSKVAGPYRQLNPRPKPTILSAGSIKSKRKEVKQLIDQLAKRMKTYGEKMPLALQPLHREKAGGYASKLSDLAETAAGSEENPASSVAALLR